MSFGERIQKLQEITLGWLNYFRMASLKGKKLTGGSEIGCGIASWHHWRAVGEPLPVSIYRRGGLLNGNWPYSIVSINCLAVIVGNFEFLKSFRFLVIINSCPFSIAVKY